jgi:NADH:ubiquinone oxidoreductase subunit C
MSLVTLHYVIKFSFKDNLDLKKFLKLRSLSKNLYCLFFRHLFTIIIRNNYLYLVLKDNNISNIMFFLKNHLLFNFTQLLDIITVDKLEMNLVEGKRFSYTYVLLSVLYNIRIFVNGFIGLFENLNSVSSIFKSADWLEREIWDMFGIFFLGHTNLRRILTDYGFVGFPLRKDFPLSGYVEIRYDEITKSIVLEPLELTQEFRFFKLEIPWRKD